ncbi:MAG: hypothetical protein ACTSXQ_07720 [Alphaproteobacteria bacterium]
MENTEKINDLIVWMKILSTTIALVMVYISYRQWKTSEYKRKQDLFNRRFKIYTEALNLYKAVHLDGSLSEEAILNLIDLYNQALFLFNKELALYILSLRDLKKDDKIDLDFFNKQFKRYMKIA